MKQKTYVSSEHARNIEPQSRQPVLHHSISITKKTFQPDQNKTHEESQNQTNFQDDNKINFKASKNPKYTKRNQVNISSTGGEPSKVILTNEDSPRKSGRKKYFGPGSTDNRQFIPIEETVLNYKE